MDTQPDPDSLKAADMRPDINAMVVAFRLAEAYVAGRALDGVDSDLDHVTLTMYDALLPLIGAEREVRVAQIERLMHAPTAH